MSTNLLTPTPAQLRSLRRRAVNDTTRAIARWGVRLTWAQADDLGELVLDWMRQRLDLTSETDEDGIVFRPAASQGGAR